MTIETKSTDERTAHADEPATTAIGEGRQLPSSVACSGELGATLSGVCS